MKLSFNDCTSNQITYHLFVQELVENLSKGELSKEDYPCLNDPSPTFHGRSHVTAINHPPVAHSMRSRRTPTWARPRNSDDGYSRYHVTLLDYFEYGPVITFLVFL